ncbi:MAG TPA: hypothetical protein VJS44_10790 [Pyrinomonadaceae bacterium]|nr:hypothetical protein [Pyrinomonadaceae bacterium]
MRDDELQMRAQRSLQEFDDAVERLEPNYAELGQRALAALEEFIEFWKNHPESPQSRADEAPASDSPEEGNEMRRFVERQLEWGEAQTERVRAHLSKEG